MLINRKYQKPEPKPRVWPANEPKPKLPSIPVPVYRVHYRALETYLAQVYNLRDYDFLRATGTKGLAVEYRVAAELTSAWNAHTLADRIRCGQRTANVQLILNVLCLDGFIGPGLYIIDTRPEQNPIDHYRLMLETTRNPQDSRCIYFRTTHKEDRVFTEQAAILDKAVVAWLKNQE